MRSWTFSAGRARAVVSGLALLAAAISPGCSDEADSCDSSGCGPQGGASGAAGTGGGGTGGVGGAAGGEGGFGEPCNPDAPRRSLQTRSDFVDLAASRTWAYCGGEAFFAPYTGIRFRGDDTYAMLREENGDWTEGPEVGTWEITRFREEDAVQVILHSEDGYLPADLRFLRSNPPTLHLTAWGDRAYEVLFTLDTE